MKTKTFNFKLQLLWPFPCYLDLHFPLNSYNSLNEVNVFIKVNVVLCLCHYCSVCNIDPQHVSYINCVTEGVQVCAYMYVYLRVCVCTWVWKIKFDFLPNTWYLIPILNMWMSEVTVYISTFLLAEKSIFWTNKLHYFLGLQWSGVKVAINHRIGSKWRLSSHCL